MSGGSRDAILLSNMFDKLNENIIHTCQLGRLQAYTS